MCVCVCVCVCDCVHNNSKTNDPKVFKLGIGNDLGGHRSDMVFCQKVKVRVRVAKKIFQPCWLEWPA